MSMEEYDQIEEYTTTKEIWDAFKIHCEGTDHVKEERIDMGVKEFEIFLMIFFLETHHHSQRT